MVSGLRPRAAKARLRLGYGATSRTHTTNVVCSPAFPTGFPHATSSPSVTAAAANPPGTRAIPTPRTAARSPLQLREPSGAPSAGEKKRPTYKVGPIITDKSSCVECAVWENELTGADGRTFTVHNVTVQASYRDAEGNWKPTKSFRGSQLYVLLYCLQKASDFILSQRDPANDCPF